MTSFSVPLPPDELGLVWDKDGDRWSRMQKDPPNSSHRGPGGWWAHALGRQLHWSDLIDGHGPLSSERLRCAARIELESPSSDAEWDMLRCVHVPGHSGLHHPDLEALKWDEKSGLVSP